MVLFFTQSPCKSQEGMALSLRTRQLAMVSPFTMACCRGWTRQSNWRVEGADFVGCRQQQQQQRLFPRLQSATLQEAPSSMAFCLAKGASTSSDSRCLSCLNPPSLQTISHEKKKRKEKIGAVCLRKNEGVLLCFVFEQTSSFVSLFN